jgi:hypothetical protein
VVTTAFYVYNADLAKDHRAGARPAPEPAAITRQPVKPRWQRRLSMLQVLVNNGIDLAVLRRAMIRACVIPAKRRTHQWPETRIKKRRQSRLSRSTVAASLASETKRSSRRFRPTKTRNSGRISEPKD